MSERIKEAHRELLKAREWLKKNNIEDPTGRLAQKCANEKLKFLRGEIK